MAYLGDKKGYRQRLAEHYNCSIDKAKKLLLCLTHGGTEWGWKLRERIHVDAKAPPFVKAYETEMAGVCEQLIEWFPKIAKFSKDRYNARKSQKTHRSRMGWKATALADILQTQENKAIMHADAYFSTVLHRNVDVLIYDGLLIRRKVRGTSDVTDQNLRDCEQCVYEKCGLRIVLDLEDVGS